MKIAISGMPGSGKSTIAKKLASKYNLAHTSMGDLRGQMALERGITLDQLNALAKTDPSVHTDVENFAFKYGRINDNFVMDAWLSFYTVPDGFKIFLDLDIDTTATRIFQDRQNRPDEKKYESVADVKSTLQARIEDMRQTWLRLYQVDFMDLKNYDVVIDTAHLTLDEVFAEIENTLRAQNLIPT